MSYNETMMSQPIKKPNKIEELYNVLSKKNQELYNKNPKDYNKYWIINKNTDEKYLLQFDIFMFVNVQKYIKNNHQYWLNKQAILLDIKKTHQLNNYQKFILEFLTNPHPQDNLVQEHKDAILDGGFKKFDKIYVYQNTYFHSLIANDRTFETLMLLNNIKLLVEKNKTKTIADIVPFTTQDYQGKNLMMLSLIKKYDYDINNDKYDISKDKECKIIKKKLANEYNINKHYQKYHNIDGNLLTFLIKNSPKECFLQQDINGFNILDYAILKMDTNALKQIIERAQKNSFLQELFNRSHFIKNQSIDNLSNLSWREAFLKIYKLYSYGLPLQKYDEWCKKKQQVIHMLEQEISNLQSKKNDLIRKQMPKFATLKQKVGTILPPIQESRIHKYYNNKQMIKEQSQQSINSELNKGFIKTSKKNNTPDRKFTNIQNEAILQSNKDIDRKFNYIMNYENNKKIAELNKIKKIDKITSDEKEYIDKYISLRYKNLLQRRYNDFEYKFNKINPKSNWYKRRYDYQKYTDILNNVFNKTKRHANIKNQKSIQGAILPKINHIFLH